MPVSVAPPPRIRFRSSSYDSLFHALIADPGGWASLPLDEVAGRKNREKQANLLTQGKRRGVRIQTSCQDGRIYARIITAPQRRYPERGPSCLCQMPVCECSVEAIMAKAEAARQEKP
jgi:hypothetical protein